MSTQTRSAWTDIKSRAIAWSGVAILAVLAVLAAAPAARAAGASASEKYPAMAALDRYLMERDAEVILARSAAPPSISNYAEVMVLGQHGYESAARGTNGFVCLVQRSWAAAADDPEFWNSRLRAPICFNPAAVRSFLPHITKKTDWVLAGRSKAQILEDIKSAVAARTLPTPEIGAMCYMMSKQGFLGDGAGHWHPHLMFFLPRAEARTWGADLPGSPVLSAEDKAAGITIFLVPVARWSDGTKAAEPRH